MSCKSSLKKNKLDKELKCSYKKKQGRQKRHIEDTPFYNYKYQYDELPLDPAKPFIIEKIFRNKKSTDRSFNIELDFHYYHGFKKGQLNAKYDPESSDDSDTEKMDIKDIILPDEFSILLDKPEFPYSFKTNETGIYPWLNPSESPSEDFVYDMTLEILEIYRNRRVKIFLDNARTKHPLYTQEFHPLYGGPSDCIGAYKSPAVSNLRLVALRKRKKSPIFKSGDTRAFRTKEQLRAELLRMSDVIDKLIEPDIKRGKLAAAMQEGDNIRKSLKHSKCDNCHTKNVIRTCVPKEKPTPEQYMKMLKAKEKKKFQYLEGLQPVDPEVQKFNILKNYENDMEKTYNKFTTKIYQRTISLMKNLSILELEIYPSNLIKKVLPKIDSKNPYFLDAYKFILEEEKIYPHISPELILLDYLFNSDQFSPNFKEYQAVLIVSCLVDLQEDFRFYVKRAFIRYILLSNFERTRLQLEIEPPEFPILLIRAPVPWKSNIYIAKNRLDQVLMISHPVLIALNTLWHQLYHDILIFDTTILYDNEIPLNADEMLELVNDRCLIARDILVNDWLPRCADLVDAMKKTWNDMVPMNSSYGGRALMLFNCVHSLMSLHLRGLINRSIDHLYKTLSVYMEGVLHMYEYDRFDLKLKRKPFMTIIVSVIGKHFDNALPDIQSTSLIYKIDEDDPQLFETGITEQPDYNLRYTTSFILKNDGKMYVYPYMREFPELFIGLFKKILKVGYDIPRIEYLMSKRDDQYAYLQYIHEDHVDMQNLYNNVTQIVENNWSGPKVFLYPIYEYYFPLISGKMRKITESIFVQRIIPDLPLFELLMKEMFGMLNEIYYLRDSVPLNLFMLDNRHVNLTLKMLVYDVMDFVTNYFKIKNRNENRRICDELEEMSIKAGERPEETAEVVALQQYIAICRDEKIFKLKEDIKVAAKRVMFLIHYATLDSDDTHLNSRTFLLPYELEQVLELSAARLNVVRDNLEVSLREKRSKFEIFMLSQKKIMDAFRRKDVKDVLTLDELRDKVNEVDALFDILTKSSKEAKMINVDEGLLQIDVSSFPILQELIENMDPIEKLWKTAYEFESNYETWMYGPFENLNSDVIRDEIGNMHKVIYKLARQLAGNPMAKKTADTFRIKIDKFKVYLPILDAICRQGLEMRHWDMVSDLIGRSVNPKLYPSLKDMIDNDIMSILPQLEDISNAAYKEFELNNQLVQMQSEWTDILFDLLPYRDSDTHILAGIDDIQTLLDDQVLKSQAMGRSPYIVALGTKADDWEEKLLAMQDIIDVWVEVQATWMYLEPIFSSEDIMRQMPVEGRNFKTVDKIWRKVLKYANKDRHVIAATDYPDLLQVWRESLAALESVSKGLNTYLEQKRLFFARFFFLSNDELLEILSETKDPTRVQPHLKKCFEGIYSLKFDETIQITAMVSAEDEVVKLLKRINPNAANGLVELWLKEVEIAMLESVQEQLRLALENYYMEIRNNWVIAWPGQIVQTISCLTWTSEVEEAIEINDLPGYLTKCNQQIGGLVQLVRTNLLSGQRITIEALIVLDVHSRDVLVYMIEQNVNSLTDFDYISQLRYYWRSENKIEWLCVSMVVTDVKYGMEYLGNISRLVVTPLTDRCYRTIMGALKLCLGGAPEGPAGTGKTETCKDLAKSVAKKCVVFNCSDGLDFKALGKFFKGLAQSGSWACFDEFNRIELEVLSVVAQQILTIQRAIMRKVVKFFFEDTLLRLDPTCTCFITMNPGYAGRTELPDNLKVLFRTVAMMVPDYAMIGEITLYSNGFDDARPLAQKIVHTYKLCSEQLSSQSHYDYGMRAVKSVLLASASLRIMHKDLPEAQIVLRAIIDVNLPKFLEQDVSLFIGIYSDLFPGVEVPQPARDDLLKWLKVVLDEKNLQATPWFVEKCLQVYEMLLVRHGLMIVGAPMGGKTTSYQRLADALKLINKDRDATQTEYPTNYRIINPKAITMGQLYGSFDPISHEWSDGVLAKTYRDMVNGSPTERYWILFDGPVDAVWIENLNTVLDDNKKLCLMSGEIIQMTKLMNMMFEPADLEQASPATVSRCGMIYMEPEQLGWRALHASYLNVLEQFGLNEIYMSLYCSLVDWLMPATLEIIPHCKAMLELSTLYQYQMFSKFFLIILQRNSQYNQQMFQQSFLFCLVWAYGSALTVDGIRKFDEMLRRILYGANEEHPKSKYFTLNRGQMFPEKGTILSYRFDEAETWWPWLKTDAVSFPDDAQLTDIIVPTKETSCIRYWLDFCITSSIPMMVIGPTGTGKSATIVNYILSLPKNANLINIVNLSARSTANQIQDTIMLKLDRRRKGVFGPPVGKQCIIFCDDVGMPAKDTYGAQGPLELIRQWLDHGYWSDLKDTTKIELLDLNFLGAMGPVGGSNFIFPRFYTHTFCVAVDSFEDTTIQRIFCSIGDWHFQKGYTEKVSMLTRGLADAMINVYREAMTVFLPTPAKSHYSFSLRDVTRVFQGIIMVPPARLSEPEKLGRLWVHETYRVFYDRLIEQKDRDILLEIVKNTCKSCLRFPLDQAMAEYIGPGDPMTDDTMRSLFFGNYMQPDAERKIYDEVDSYPNLEKIMQFYLKDYNELTTSPMDLVLFRFAIEHISRVSRVLQMPRGNILMVGVGGSGRRSTAKLAASIAEAKLSTIQLTKTYSTQDWREDLKKILMFAGTNMKPTVFLFSDSQAINEGFVEDINGILNTGDLPNLYQSDDKATILENMMNIAKTLGKTIENSPLEMFNFFVDRVREQLHIALAFSPIGDSFKERLRTYPSLITCCTIDWFVAWPVDALVRVAEHFISSMNLSRKEGDDVVANPDVSSTESTSQHISQQEIVLSELENKLVLMVMHFNVSVVDASEKCFFELGRRNYVTPTSYLQMLKSFKMFYINKYNEIIKMRDRYTNGLEKLEFAAGQVGVMQENLRLLQPVLKTLSEETEKIMVNIERETAEAEKKKEIVGADEAAANEAAAAAQAIKDDCEGDLAEAIPALDAALEALQTLKPADIVVVKSMKSPPSIVKLVLEAVCVIRGFKPDRKPDATGRMVEDYWGPSQKMLGDIKFLDTLKAFDKDNIPPAVMKKIREKYIPDRDFVPDKVRSASAACEGLCKWVKAMDVYDRVAKIVAPKKLSLASAEDELAAQMDKLNSKRAELQVILDKLQELNDFFAEKSRAKKQTEDEIELCEKKLDRAEKLLGGLGGEKTRWSESAHNLNESIINIVGDVLLAAGAVAYLGFFPTEYRASVLNEWNDLCVKKKIPCSEKFSLAATLGNPMEIRAWSLNGLPTDNFSVENGIIVTRADRFPLLIDPQVQANKWIKNMERKNDLKVIKQTDDNYMRILELAVNYGTPVLLENVGERLDANLVPILEKNIIKSKGGFFIKAGDQLIEYNNNFRLYITTCLRNPHYLPETMVMVTILNFMITEQGLREQLLATVVAYERPDLQEKKEQLIVESAKNRDTLYNIESQILQVLSSSEGNVLEDENAINILTSSKILSEDIQEKQIVAVATEIEIDKARQQYIPVSSHSAILFFCISELANIDPMYQYALAWFLNLFINTLLKAPKSKELSVRLVTLNDYFTKSIYVNVCRSLFEKDKLVISFVMCIRILMAEGQMDTEHLIFFLTGGVGLENPHANPASVWLTDKAWSQIVRASNLKGLELFYKNFADNIAEWRKFYDLLSPEEATYPSPYEDVDQVLGLIILKCIRPDKVVPATRNFITRNMNSFFVEPPPFDLHSSFSDSSPTTPLVFLLSAGSDPMASLMMYAKQMNMYDKTKTISLGQGQGPRAEKMIIDGIRYGHWVVLQNCHVAESWMGELERICNDTTLTEGANHDYRLWCTSYPSRIFPVSVLQNSVKMTNEAPKGLKMNMLRSFSSDPLVRDKFFSNAFVGDAARYWLRGVFALVFFHAVIQERREFGPLGWNIPYEFNESDLKISLVQLKMFIKQNKSIPFRGHVYLTGECNYGGRVTDDKDRRLILSLLNMIYNQSTIDIDEYNISQSGQYKIPLKPNRLNSIEYVSQFPLSPNPEVFGLHENADINRNNKETNSLLQGVLKTQTDLLASTKSSSSSATAVDPAFHLCKEILNRLPKKYDVEEVSLKYPVMYTNSMNTVLRQELIRFNRLLEYIRKSLINVQKAIQGQIAMIPELERIHRAMILGKLPADWLKKSYPSLKPLGSYINDFLARLDFLTKWIDDGEPIVYWLSGFYFTQSFITGVLQNYSRKHRLQIDLVGIQFRLTKYESNVDSTTDLGVYVKGLFLEGARYNRQTSVLDESYPKILFDTLPVIILVPLLKSEEAATKTGLIYESPIYKTSERRGTLSTTGHSTNFVMFIPLPSNDKPTHWINRGTACLCQLDD